MTDRTPKAKFYVEASSKPVATYDQKAFQHYLKGAQGTRGRLIRGGNPVLAQYLGDQEQTIVSSSNDPWMYVQPINLGKTSAADDEWHKIDTEKTGVPCVSSNPGKTLPKAKCGVSQEFADPKNENQLVAKNTVTWSKSWLIFLDREKCNMYDRPLHLLLKRLASSAFAYNCKGKKGDDGVFKPLKL